MIKECAPIGPLAALYAIRLAQCFGSADRCRPLEFIFAGKMFAASGTHKALCTLTFPNWILHEILTIDETDSTNFISYIHTTDVYIMYVNAN